MRLRFPGRWLRRFRRQTAAEAAWPRRSPPARMPAGRVRVTEPVAPFGSPVLPDQARSGHAAHGGHGRRARPEPGSAAPRRPAAGGGRAGASRAAVRTAPGERGAVRDAARPPVPGQPPGQARELLWYEVAQARRLAAGRRDCGPLEAILNREWAPGEIPPPEVVRAVDRLAGLPDGIKQRLAVGLDAIHVGAGGVPDLDHMMRLRGVPLPSGRATWDACAGAYGERKVIVGTRPSSAPDVMCHEIGHALDDIDGDGDTDGGGWQSDSEEFRSLYDRCMPLLVSDFHRQDGPLGRREFFADAFSAIASRQRPALMDMLGGHTRTGLEVMLFFNVRYGI